MRSCGAAGAAAAPRPCASAGSAPPRKLACAATTSARRANQRWGRRRMRRQGIRWERALHHPHTGEESNRCRAEAEDPQPVASPRAQKEEEREHHEDEEKLTE